jgi:hypothetical protein
VEDAHGVVLLGEPVGDLARAVGRAVVHHEDRVFAAGRGELLERRAHDGVDVLGLVVRRQDEPGAGQSAA